MDIVERLRVFEGSDDLGNGDFSLLGQAAQHIRVLEALLAECAQDLRAEVYQRYRPDGISVHPALLRRYKRDMKPVEMAEAILATLPEPAHQQGEG